VELTFRIKLEIEYSNITGRENNDTLTKDSQRLMTSRAMQHSDDTRQCRDIRRLEVKTSSE